MKFKFYLNVFLLAVATLSLAAGCDDNKEPQDDPNAPDFVVSISNIAQGTAVVNITPKDASATYYYGAIPKSEYSKYTSETAFLVDDLKRIEGLAAEKQMTLTAYLEAFAGRGAKQFPVNTPFGKTGYYAYAYGINTDGKATTTVFKEQFISERTNIAPALTLTMKAGDINGNNKESLLMAQTQVTGQIPATTARILFWETYKVEYNLDKGETYETIVKDWGGALNAEEIKQLNGTGHVALLGAKDSERLARGDSYTVIFMASAPDGTTETKHATMKTEIGDLQLTIDITNITSTSVRIIANSNENNTPFYLGMLTAEEYTQLGGTPETAIPSYMEALWVKLQKEHPDRTLPQIITRTCPKGSIFHTPTNLTSGATYYAFAVPVDYNGQMLIPAVVKDFTLPNAE